MLGTLEIPDVTKAGREERGGGGNCWGEKLTACVLFCLGGWSSVMLHKCVNVRGCGVRLCIRMCAMMHEFTCMCVRACMLVCVCVSILNESR